MQPPGSPQSDPSSLDQNLPSPQTPKRRPSSWDTTFEEDMSSFRYSATSQEIENLEEVPMETAWRLFLGEVGSICPTESSLPSLPTGSVTSEDLVWLETQWRARAHRYSYLNHVRALTAEQVMKRDAARLARARRQAYSTLVGALSPAELKQQEFKRRQRCRVYAYLQLGRLTQDELVERDEDRRDHARFEAYLTLTGELQ